MVCIYLILINGHLDLFLIYLLFWTVLLFLYMCPGWHDPEFFWDVYLKSKIAGLENMQMLNLSSFSVIFTRVQPVSRPPVMVEFSLISAEITPRLDDSLGEVTELKAVKLTVTVCYFYSERYRLKSAKGVDTRVEFQDKQPQASRCPGCTLFRQQRCFWRMCKCCQPGKFAWALVFRLLMGGQSHKHAAPVWLTSATQTPAPWSKYRLPPESQCWYELSDHTSRAWPKDSGILLLVRKFRAYLRNWPRASPEDPPFLGVCRVWATQARWVSPFPTP